MALVGDVPRFNQDPGLCVYAVPGKSSASCKLSIEEAERQAISYDAVLHRLSEDFGVPYVSIDKSLCSEDGCEMSKDGSILYRDNNHLNIVGSKIVGKVLAEKLYF